MVSNFDLCSVDPVSNPGEIVIFQLCFVGRYSRILDFGANSKLVKTVKFIQYNFRKYNIDEYIGGRRAPK